MNDPQIPLIFWAQRGGSAPSPAALWFFTSATRPIEAALFELGPSLVTAVKGLQDRELCFVGCEGWRRSQWDDVQRLLATFAPKARALFFFAELPGWSDATMRQQCRRVPAAFEFPKHTVASPSDDLARRISTLTGSGRLDLALAAIDSAWVTLSQRGYTTWLCELVFTVNQLAPSMLNADTRERVARYFHLRAEDGRALELLRASPLSEATWNQWWLRSRVCLRLGRMDCHDQCLSHMNRLAKSDDDRAVAKIECLNRQNLQRDTASAQATIQELRKILENPNISNSTRGLFHFFAGQFDKRGGRNDEAADHYRIAVKYLTGQNERHHELLLSRLNFFHTQFDLLQWTALDKGLTCLEEEVFANQYTFLLAGVLNLKANLLVRQGRLAKALESLSTSESLVDEQDHYHRLLIRHKRVVALRHLGQWTEALAIIEASSQEARHVGQWGPWARIELERMRVLTYLGQSDAALDAGRTLLASKRLSAVEHHLVHNQMGVTEGFANGDVESALSHTVPVDDQEIHIEPWDVKHVPEVWNEDFSHFLDAGSSRRSSGLHEPWSSLAFARTHRTRPMSLPEKLKYSPLLEALCRRLDITVPDGVTPSPEWATKAIGSWEALLAATVPMVSDKAVTVVYPGGDRHELSAQVLDRLCHQHKGMVVDQVRDRIYVVGQEVVALKRPSVLKRVLYCLVKHRPRACSKETIIHEVWRRNYNPAVDDPLIYTTIRRLRSFLEQDLKHPRYIQHSDNSYLLNFKEGVLVVERAMTSAVRDPLEWAAKYCREHGKISRLELTRQFALSESTAKRMLSQWLAEKRVTQHGSGRGTHYTFVEATPAPTQST